MELVFDEKSMQTAANALRDAKRSLKRQLDKKPESEILWAQFRDVMSALEVFERYGY